MTAHLRPAHIKKAIPCGPQGFVPRETSLGKECEPIPGPRRNCGNHDPAVWFQTAVNHYLKIPERGLMEMSPDQRAGGFLFQRPKWSKHGAGSSSILIGITESIVHQLFRHSASFAWKLIWDESQVLPKLFAQVSLTQLLNKKKLDPKNSTRTTFTVKLRPVTTLKMELEGILLKLGLPL